MTQAVRTSVAGGNSPRRRRRALNFSFDSISFWVCFLFIPLGLFLLLVIWPFVQAAYYSLTRWTGFSAPEFIGIENFKFLLQDDKFMTALGNNVKLAIILPTLTIVIALTFATLITVGGASKGQIRGLRGSSFYRVVSFFPYTIPAIVIGLLWALVALPDGGLLNGFLTAIGFDQFENYPWLGKEATAMPFSIFVIMWSLIGFYMLLFIAAIKDVPAETYEAARLDGAGRFRTAISITVPLIRDNIQTAWIYLGISALDAFVYMQALNSGGGPNNSTLVVPQYLFTAAFQETKFGYATAMGVALAGVTLIYAGIVFGVNWLTGGRDRKPKIGPTR